MALPANTLADIAFANELAFLAGLNSWDLQQAQYNGVTFQVLLSFAAANNSFRGASTTFGNIIGSGGLTGPDNTLPFGTIAALEQAQDVISRRLVIHEIPNRNGNFIEDLGFTGETYTMVGILVGPEYMDRLTDVRTYFTNDNLPSSIKNVLVHPINGKIFPAYLSSWRLIHSSKKWRAVAYEFTFVCDNIPSPLPESNSINNAIYAALAEIENLVISLAEVLSLGSLLFSRLADVGASKFKFGSTLQDDRTLNPVVRTELDALNAANQLISLTYQYCCKILYTYLKPPGFSDFYLDRIQVDLNLVPSLFRYVTIFTEKEANILVSFYAGQAEILIEQYRQFHLDTIFGDQILSIKKSVVSLDNFAKTLLNLSQETYLSYTVPYSMSLRQVLWINGLDLNKDYIPMMLLNRSILGSTNQLPAGMILRLRKVNNS